MVFHEGGRVTWMAFYEAFLKNYFTVTEQVERVREFVHLGQGDMTVTQYTAKFMELSYFALVYVLNLVDRAQKFENKLQKEIQSKISIMRIRDYLELLERAKLIEKTLIGQGPLMKGISSYTLQVTIQISKH